MVLGGIAVTSLASTEEPDEAAPAPTWHGPPATRRIARLRPPVPILLALVAAVLFGLFFVGVDQGGAAAGGSVLWVALGVQLGALPTTLACALRSRGRRLGIDDPALLAPVALLTVLGSKPPSTVTINEFTTVASVWTNNQFLNGPALQGHALGLKIAAGNVPSFVDLQTG